MAQPSTKIRFEGPASAAWQSVGSAMSVKDTGAVETTPTQSGPVQPQMTTEPVNNTVTTDQLEQAETATFTLPEPTEITKVDVTPTAPPAPTAQELEKQATAKEQERLRGEIDTAFDEIGDIASFEEGLGESVELQKKREAKTDIDNKITAKNREFDLSLREADAAFGTRAQKNAKKREIARDFNTQLADLAIIQMARAGEFNDAQAYVNKKVEAELSIRKNKLDKLAFFYNENKERFNTLDQREFEKKIKEEERAYQKEYDKTKQLEDIKATMTINAAEAGAGNSVLQAIQSAGSLTDLMGLPNAGVYTKSKADRLAEQLTELNLSNARLDAEKVERNLVQTGISPVTGEAFTEGQAKAGTFAVRMDQAEDILSGGKGRFLPFVPDFAKSAERRQFEQAERNFITAQLRRESGANIADSEFEDARRVYIPIATDDKKTLQNKAEARKTVIQGMKNESAGAFEQWSASLEATDSGSTDVSSYVDIIEQQLNDPYANLLSGFNTSTPAVMR